MDDVHDLPAKALTELLIQGFDAAGPLRIFLVLSYPDIAPELPADIASHAALAFTAAQLLERHKRIDARFFDQLRARRPALQQQIRECAAGFGVTLPDAPIGIPPIAPPELQPDDDALERWLAGVRGRSRQTRHALDPLMLPRVPRQVVRVPLAGLPETFAGRRKPILAFLGPAGSGKTTLLGEMVDGIDDPAVVVFIVRGNDLGLDVVVDLDQLHRAVSRLTSGDDVLLIDVVQHVHTRGRRAIVFLDTLDIVLDERSVHPWMELLARLVDAGAVVVLSCRDQEFREFVEPEADRFRSVLARLHPFPVPPFTDEEVVAAAAGFHRVHHPQAGEDASQTFARRLLELSADRRSLAQIVHRPLLLAMLCSLHREHGTVPPDLTVSELYYRYWELKVFGTRRPGQRDLRAAKQAYCYGLAEACFDPEVGLIRDSADPSTRYRTPLADAAVRDLQSENVLIETLAGRIQFFHQTFLEYAIARWLTTPDAEATRHRLFAHLRRPSALVGAHVWFILRQLLAICDRADYAACIQGMDLASLPAFRTLALATVARRDPEARSDLEVLVDRAVEFGGEFAALLVELIDVTDATAEPLWRLCERMMADDGHTVASRGMRLAGKLLRAAAVPAEGLSVALALAEARPNGSIMIGVIAEALRDPSEAPPRASLLAALRVHYPRLSAGGKRTVLQLHIEHASPAECTHLLAALKALADTELPDELEALQLVVRVYEDDPGSIWDDPLTGLDPAGPARQKWRDVFSRALGRLAVRSPTHLDTLVTNLLAQDNPMEGWLDTFTALHEAIRHGGGTFVAERLADATAPETGLKDMRRLLGALSVVFACTDVSAERLVTNLARAFPGAPNELAKVMTEAGLRYPIAWDIVRTHFDELDPGRQRSVVQALVEAPLRYRADLAMRCQAIPATDRIRLECELARAIVQDDPASEQAALEQVVHTAGGAARIAALEAAHLLRRLARSLVRFPGAQIVGLVSSRFPGVRTCVLEAFHDRVECRDVDDAELVALVTALDGERVPTVLRPLGLLITGWVKHRRAIPRRVEECLCAHILVIITDPGADAGSLRELVRAFKSIVQLPDIDVPRCTAVAEALAQSSHVGRMSDGETLVARVLAALADVNDELLTRLFASIESLPRRNAQAVLYAQTSRLGWYSPKINALLRRPDLPDWLRTRILEGQDD